METKDILALFKDPSVRRRTLLHVKDEIELVQWSSAFICNIIERYVKDRYNEGVYIQFVDGSDHPDSRHTPLNVLIPELIRPAGLEPEETVWYSSIGRDGYKTANQLRLDNVNQALKKLDNV